MNSLPPAAPWARRKDAKPKPRPQAISHRGYKAVFPENTMVAFRGAVDVGADAIETDLHLSKDGAVVLSHDATLKRCYGVPQKVAECDWDYLSTLRTLREPKEPIPRLVDLLEYLNEPGQEHIWLFLDIKTDDDPTQMLTCLAAAIASVKSTTQPWEQRIILGSWDANWLATCLRSLPGFPVALTAYSPEYATELLPFPNLAFNIFNITFSTPSGSRFLRAVRQRRSLVFSWTDNEDEYMARSLRNEVDGVITDDPKRFLELCAKWEEEEVREKASKTTMRTIVFWIVINIMAWVAEIVLRLRQGSPRARVEKALGRIGT